MVSNSDRENRPTGNRLKTKVFDIIFGHDTPAGLGFDLTLLVFILLSVAVVCIETLPDLKTYVTWFLIAELAFTAVFTLEYLTRLWCVQRPSDYAFSFFGIVDLMAILPSLLAAVWFLMGNFASENFFEEFAKDFVFGNASYAVIRSLRLLRVFRLLRVGKLERESGELAGAIWKARSNVVVFLGTVMITVIIAGAMMYEIEKFAEDESQIHSIPEGIYWAIVTMTTVGYGDIVPQTVAGKLVSALLILIGYSLIIVPTGFVSAEVVSNRAKFRNGMVCPECHHRGHDTDAIFCKMCGAKFGKETLES